MKKIKFVQPIDGNNVVVGKRFLPDVLNEDFFLLKDKNTGVIKKVFVENGALSVEDYKIKVLCLGNSITIHPITDFWWGKWGMAATKEEKDFVHILNKKDNLACDAVSIAVPFERELKTDINTCINEGEKTKENISVSDYDRIVIRLGENVTNIQGFKPALLSLIDNIRTVNQKASILITGMFWTNDQKEAILLECANEKSCTFVSIKDLDVSAYKQTIGGQVYGNDGALHTINNQGVANHPNDEGMRLIAERIYSALVE